LRATPDKIAGITSPEAERSLGEAFLASSEAIIGSLDTLITLSEVDLTKFMAVLASLEIAEVVAGPHRVC